MMACASLKEILDYSSDDELTNTVKGIFQRLKKRAMQRGQSQVFLIEWPTLDELFDEAQ